MIKPITTKKELKDFQDYLAAPKCCGLSDFYKTGYSTTKQEAWEGIMKECSNNRGTHLTVIHASPKWFITGYMICASDTEWYFVCHRPSFRCEYKLTAEQIEKAREVINGRN